MDGAWRILLEIFQWKLLSFCCWCAATSLVQVPLKSYIVILGFSLSFSFSLSLFFLSILSYAEIVFLTLAYMLFRCMKGVADAAGLHGGLGRNAVEHASPSGHGCFCRLYSGPGRRRPGRKPGRAAVQQSAPSHPASAVVPHLTR